MFRLSTIHVFRHTQRQDQCLSSHETLESSSEASGKKIHRPVARSLNAKPSHPIFKLYSENNALLHFFAALFLGFLQSHWVPFRVCSWCGKAHPAHHIQRELILQDRGISSRRPLYRLAVSRGFQATTQLIPL